MDERAVNLTPDERSLAVSILRSVSCVMQFDQETGAFQIHGDFLLTLTVPQKASLTRLIAKF